MIGGQHEARPLSEQMHMDVPDPKGIYLLSFLAPVRWGTRRCKSTTIAVAIKVGEYRRGQQVRHLDRSQTKAPVQSVVG